MIDLNSSKIEENIFNMKSFGNRRLEKELKEHLSFAMDSNSFMSLMKKLKVLVTVTPSFIYIHSNLFVVNYISKYISLYDFKVITRSRNIEYCDIIPAICISYNFDALFKSVELVFKALITALMSINDKVINHTGYTPPFVKRYIGCAAREISMASCLENTIIIFHTIESSRIIKYVVAILMFHPHSENLTHDKIKSILSKPGFEYISSIIVKDGDSRYFFNMSILDESDIMFMCDEHDIEFVFEERLSMMESSIV